MEPNEALTRRDAEIASRIARLDESVLRDIQDAYERSLRRLLERSLGSALNDHDVDDILSQTLSQTWKGYGENRGGSVRHFYFSVGKRRLQDHLKRNLRRQRREEAAAAQIIAARDRMSPPGDECILSEEVQATAAGTAKAVLTLVDDAVGTLTARQRRAFLCRFGAAGGDKWAKHLETETGVPAKQWRKASDEARVKVREHLIKHGVHYSREGGRYEVA
jgi:DNA-directed RNA polymerase specialized sigma24 family protein